MKALDGPDRLSEVADIAVLEELCTDWMSLHRVAVRLFDPHQLLVDDPVLRGTQALLVNLTRKSDRQTFVDFVSSLKQRHVGAGREVLVDPVLGARFMRINIIYEGTTLAHLVAGPYQRAEGMLDPLIPRCDDDALEPLVRYLIKAIDLVCHAGYKRWVTSEVHLQAMTQAYDDQQLLNVRLAQANEKLVDTNRRLKELDRLKSDFMANVSHELRTPLTSVIGYSEMLIEGLAGPINTEQREYLGTIMERSESLLRLIEDILTFSRGEREQRGARVTVQIDALIDAALQAVRPQAKKRELVLELAIDPDLPSIEAYPDQIVQVLINLLGNAVKFTPEGGLIRVAATATSLDGGPVVRLAISDTGIGIPADLHSQVFEPFFQVDGTSTREYGGTGLGLSIVKGFVEGHGGRITVDSAEGVGTTFSVDLPAQARPA